MTRPRFTRVAKNSEILGREENMFLVRPSTDGVPGGSGHVFRIGVSFSAT